GHGTAPHSSRPAATSPWPNPSKRNEKVIARAATKVDRTIAFLIASGCLLSTALGHYPPPSTASLPPIYDSVTAPPTSSQPDLAHGHRQYLTVHDEQNRPLSERMLDATHYRFELKLPASAAKPETAHPFRQFVNLGVEHIVTGYDHLAFLLGLLLVGGSFRSALKIITSFTLAHSLTLALATFNLIRLSPTILEPLIAASIIYVGVEDLLRST